MPGWYALTLVLTATTVFLQARANGRWLTGVTVSLLLQLVVLIVTLTALVPRNNRLSQMQTAYPNWGEDARQWDRLHQLRVALLLLSTIAFAVPI